MLAADVSAAPGHEGEAGWSWYTGSAGWFFRIAAEELLGLGTENGRTVLRPAALTDWEARWKGKTLRSRAGKVSVDGEAPPEGPES